MSIWAFIWRLRVYFRRVALLLILGSACGILMNTAVVLPPIMLGRAIDAALALERGSGSVQAVGWAALLFVAATLSTEVPRIGKRWWLKYCDNRIRTEIRADALAHVLRRWPMERLHREPVGDLMARIVADVEVLGPGVRELIVETWDTLLLEVSLFVALLAYDWRLSLLVALPVPFGLYLGGRVGGAMRRRTYAARLANGVLTAAIQEALAGLRLLRLFGREEAIAARIARHSEEYARANLAVTRLRGGLAPIYGFVMTSGIVALFWLGGQEVVAGSLTVGAFVAYLDLYLRFIGRTPRVPQMVNAVQTSAAAFSRLEPLLLPDPPRPRGAGWRETFRSGFVEGTGELDGPGPNMARASLPPRGRVELRGVTFRYPSSPAPVVTDLSLQVLPGELVAVTGPVGSGKSALARALLGLYPLDAGQVLLDGRDVASLAPVERSRYIAYLPQDGFIFSGSIAENVTFGAEGGAGAADSSCSLDSVLHAVAFDEDLASMSAGVATTVGERGVRVSGGQRQRIALARALAARAAVLVLDDPFSAVDVPTERLVIERLRQGADRPTMFLFSHRLAGFPLADRILVLDAGRVVEQGTHEELLGAGGLYGRIYRAQIRIGAAAPDPSSASSFSGEARR